jgi:hypothetical protein
LNQLWYYAANQKIKCFATHPTTVWQEKNCLDISSLKMLTKITYCNENETSKEESACHRNITTTVDFENGKEFAK